jgi:tripartite-type tricarboxylate transporter receptor subunit TctC
MNGVKRADYSIKTVFVILIMFLGLAGLMGTAAAGYPEREITIMVPYAPGGATDTMAHGIAVGLEKHLGVKMLFENREGGGGSVGQAWLARQKPDGYIIGMTSTISLILQQYTGVAGLKIDQFTYLSHVASADGALAVRMDSPFKTLRDLVDYAKKNPGIITVSNSGTGSLWHLCAAGLAHKAGVEFTHVPFKGGSPAAVAMIGGHVTASSSTVGEVYEFVKAGRARILGIPSIERFSLIPDVPTFREQGYDFVFEARSGLIGPKGIPENTVKILSSAVEKAAKSEEFKKMMAKFMMKDYYLNDKQYKEWTFGEDTKVLEILKQVGLSK